MSGATFLFASRQKTSSSDLRQSSQTRQVLACDSDENSSSASQNVSLKVLAADSDDEGQNKDHRLISTTGLAATVLAETTITSGPKLHVFIYC